MANRWGNNGNSERLYLGGGGSKITADGDCSHGIRGRVLLGRKAVANLGNVLKSRDVTLPTKSISQGYGLPSGHVVRAGQ